MKNVLVTGANRGIGLATATLFKQSGYHVVATARREEDIANLAELGFESHHFDVRHRDNLDTLYTTLKANGSLPDVLVNNAGISSIELLSRVNEEEFTNLLDVNLKSAIFITKKFIRHMSKNKFGRVINISSVLGSMPQKGLMSYSVSKAGLEAFSRVIALEYAEKGITVNCVAPGYVDTDMIKNIPYAQQMHEQIPRREVATAQEIASTVLFLAQQPNITGEVINNNGGLLMKS
ncbi:SDR family NAD(P)-dependent oxidoreductase [Vibrio sp. S4M6]|uniref:SDR family NAD(P)-dependent oxidoreductase n=1 Tax=Vibrio sinus TaxID=2946865 RepID=UPI00202A333C|nr:SDR family NAD(P)-dependent oxidoreductase [Vibrio sinus]MCL9781754.1 SDR family NAD(P)-dependent oxidoreductase [Vibrio sinus]